MWSVWFVFFDCGFHSVSPVMEDKRLMEASWWERLTEEETGSWSDVWAVFHNSLIQFPVVGWSYVPSLLFDLRPNYGRGKQDTGDLFQKVPCTHYSTQCPRPCSKPLLTHTSDGYSCAGVQLQQPGNQPEGVSDVSRRWCSLWLTVWNFMFISSLMSSFILWQKH